MGGETNKWGDGWMNAWMDAWTEGWMDGWTDKENVLCIHNGKLFSLINRKSCHTLQYGWTMRTLWKMT
jgi:hypothetical protein